MNPHDDDDVDSERGPVNSTPGPDDGAAQTPVFSDDDGPVQGFPD